MGRCNCGDEKCYYNQNGGSHVLEIEDLVLPLSWQPNLIYSENNLVLWKDLLKCQCGSDSVDSPRHSSYCPKYRKPT
jgi:hypothetical protein